MTVYIKEVLPVANRRLTTYERILQKQVSLLLENESEWRGRFNNLENIERICKVLQRRTLNSFAEKWLNK